MRKLLIVAVLLALLGGVNWSAFKNEDTWQHGEKVVLELVPVDPRALLMGDYMTLNYAINTSIAKALHEAGQNSTAEQKGHSEGAFSLTSVQQDNSAFPEDGIAIMRLDHEKRATFVRLDNGTPLAQGELRVFFRVRNDRVQVAAAAYYFQEGYAQAYEQAKYGELRVDSTGKSLLVALLDKNMQRIEPEKQPR